MKNILVITFCLAALACYGQDTTYYDFNWNIRKSVNNAHYYTITHRDQADTNKVKESVFYLNGQLKTERFYSDYKNKKVDGKLKEWYESGKLRKDIDFNNGKYDGNLITYWDNGKPKRIDVFKNDSLISGKCFNSDGKEVIYYDYERVAEFPGGINNLMRFISLSVKYPEIMQKKGIGGRVLVGFVVNKNGSITDVKIVQSVNDLLDAEAMRVVKSMPVWNPGLQDGETIKVSYTIPIAFKPI